MNLENRVKQMELRVTTRTTLEEEIEELLSHFTEDEQRELLEEFIATHTFFDPSRLTDEERARNVFLAGGTNRLEADETSG